MRLKKCSDQNRQQLFPAILKVLFAFGQKGNWFLEAMKLIQLTIIEQVE